MLNRFLCLFLFLMSVPALGEPPVHVAFIVSYAGGDPNTSRELERGMRVFFKNNPAARKRLAIDRFDNHGSVLETIKILDQIRARKIDFIVGMARSDEAMAAAKVAGRMGKLLITPFATNPQIPLQGRTIFQICFNDVFQSRALAQFVRKDLKAKRILVLVNSESIYSTGLASGFQHELQLLGSAPESRRMDYVENEASLERILSEVSEFRPEFVFIPDHITRASLIAKAIRKSFPLVRFLGADGFGGKKILTSIFGDTAQIELYYTTHWSAGLDTEVNREFVETYRGEFPSDDASAGAALTYDAFKMLWDTIKVSGVSLKPAEVAARMRGTSYQFTTGTFVAPKRPQDGPQKSAVVIRLKDGEYSVFKTIDP